MKLKPLKNYPNTDITYLKRFVGRAGITAPQKEELITIANLESCVLPQHTEENQLEQLYNTCVMGRIKWTHLFHKTNCITAVFL